jgi:hypothetical protein
MSLLESGHYADAIAPLEKAEELGAFQWNPIRTVYRGEAAWALAAAHARLDHKNKATRWTRTSLAHGLREIKKFNGSHFRALLTDPQYRQLVLAPDDPKNLSRDEGLRLDLRFMVHEGKRIHYAPFRFTPEAEIDALVSALDTDIPTLSDDEVFVRFMGVIRRFGDGHTSVRHGRFSSLPIELCLFPEGLHVVAAEKSHADLVGARVVGIGNRDVAEALKLAKEIASRDNAITESARAPWLLSIPFILRGLGIISGDRSVSLEIEDVSGKTRRVELDQLTKPAPPADWVREVPGCQQPVPLSLRQWNARFLTEPLPQERMVYCPPPAIGDGTQVTMKQFCQQLFETVAQSEIEGLILDHRYNGGGDTFTIPPLIEGLIRSEKLQQPGRLFLIIGRETYSAALNTTTEIERRTNAILVGEPTCCPPNFIGESVKIMLPYSHWSLSVSDLWWQHSGPMDYRISTPPQLYAPPTVAAFRSHRDPALEAIWRYRASLVAPSR